MKDIQVNYRIIPSTEENIKGVEKLRYDAYGFSFTCEENYFAKAILDGKIIMFGCYILDELVGACYVSNSNHSLYIEQLFIKKDYQGSGLRLGRRLLEFIHLNKRIVENYFQQLFDKSILCYNSEKSKILYEKMGYYEVNSLIGRMKKVSKCYILQKIIK